MKTSRLTKMIFLPTLIVMGIIDVCAQEIKVFSKYSYYTTEKDVSIIADLSPEHYGGEYFLSVFNNSKQLARSFSGDNNLLKVAIPLMQFEFGKTQLQFSVSNKNIIVKKGSVEITRLSPKANEVKIDLQTGGLIADGIPFFPFGFYCKPVNNLPEQEVSHGFNMIGPYQSNFPDTYEERKAYMDRCAQVGMKVQYSINSLVGSGHNGAKGLDMSEEVKQEILKKEIIAFRDHPALLSWYMNDEPDGQSRPPVLLEKVYQLIKELDPYHPVSVVFMLPSKFSLFENTMDIAMTDPYPVPGPLDIVESFVQQMNNLYKYEKSVWLVPQAFGGQEMWAREPTAKEIRLMTYMGLINGVKGIQYYTHAADNLNPQSVSAWSVCSDIAVEVNQMASFLLSDETELPVISSDSGIIVRSFSRDSNLLVIAANRQNKPRPFSIQLNNAANRWTGSSTASLWFEDREVDIKNGKIEDIIDAMGTRVYLIKKKVIEVSSKIYPGNITLNPGFEKIVNPGLPIGSNTKKSFHEKNSQGASFFADPRQKVDGMFSLRLITPVDSCGVKIRLLPIVLKAGNSYSVSIWAKAKAKNKMPVFRLSVDGPQKEKTYQLTNDWQQYSFLFHADSSWSSAITCIDLLTAGTAWFDLIQVTPDPLINYMIEKNQVAKVSITTTIADAEIKYWLSNTKTDSVKYVYKQPIVINKASTIIAGIFNNDKIVSQSGSFIPVNKALGKKVLLYSEFAPQYAASGSSSLTDGMMGTTAFKDNKWLGFQGKDVSAIIDLEQMTTIRSVTINFLNDANSGIYLPPEISVYISEDGKNFQLMDTYINKEVPRMGEPDLKSIMFSDKEIKTRYIKFVANAFGDIPEGYLFKGTKSWIFIDEVMID